MPQLFSKLRRRLPPSMVGWLGVQLDCYCLGLIVHVRGSEGWTRRSPKRPYQMTLPPSSLYVHSLASSDVDFSSPLCLSVCLDVCLSVCLSVCLIFIFSMVVVSASEVSSKTMYNQINIINSSQSTLGVKWGSVTFYATGS